MRIICKLDLGQSFAMALNSVDHTHVSVSFGLGNAMTEIKWK